VTFLLCGRHSPSGIREDDPVTGMNRIFISYRSADGAKDASRLADDLGSAFGADHVFLDREDLRGGSSWRDEISRAIDHRPIVLLLITPAFFGVRHADGRLRIDDADDPVRCEILSALEAGAILMPLRVDGTAMPSADSLPEALRSVTEWHALLLRTDDWSRVDLPRIVADIQRLGVVPADARSATSVSDVRPGIRRPLAWAVAAFALAVVAGLMLAERSPPSLPPPVAVLPVQAVMTAPVHKTPSASSATLDGAWLLSGKNGERIPLHIRQRDDRLSLRSEPVRIDDDPSWKSYIEGLAASNGPRLTHIRLTAEGELFGNEADLAVVIVSADDGFVVDTGNLHLHIATDRSGLTGRVALNSGDTDAVVLVRGP
jgi:hypothetical protein